MIKENIWNLNLNFITLNHSTCTKIQSNIKW